MREEAEPGITDPADAGTHSRTGLKGWAYVEDWMTTLDKGMVGDFNEDINTLLTFAGLFSAVLAGFLIQLYAGLQPSNNQTTNNILTQISLQMGQMSQQLANSSLVPMDIPTPSPSFEVSASIVWINTLWFLSLVLSLAAALFGMISKQWLREYLKWTTMSGLSETQVGLRHGRYEAFMDWNTPAVIASMPVLLELALILFLTGMEVLLWTLNTVVFGACTVAIVALIMLVIVVTVLPAFRARCPYKSPVGWICVLMKKALRLSSTAKKDWRERDLAQQIVKVSEGWNAEAAAAVGRQQVLTRALLWIRENSQDQRLMRAVEECVANRAANTPASAFSALAADLTSVCQYLDIDPSQLVPPSCSAVQREGNPVIDDDGFSRWQLQYRIVVVADPSKAYSPSGWEHRSLPIDAPPSVCGWIAHLLGSDLLAVVTHYNTYDTYCFGNQTAYFLQASALLCGWLVSRAVYDERRPSAATDRFIELFDSLCCHYNSLKFPDDLKMILPLLATPLDQFGGWLPQPLTFPSPAALPRTHYALNTPREEPHNWTEVDCIVFIRLSQSALREWGVAPDRDTAMALLPTLLNRMTDCVHRCRKCRWRNCTALSGDVFWLLRLRQMFDSEYYGFSGQHLPVELFPHKLVNALQKCSTTGFIYNSFDLAHIRALAGRSVALKNQYKPWQAEDGTIDSSSQPQPHPTMYELSATNGSSQPSAYSRIHSSRAVHAADVLRPVNGITQDQPRPLPKVLAKLSPYHHAPRATIRDRSR